MRRAVATAAAVAFGLSATAAHAAGPPSFRVGSPPQACASSSFSDLVLSNGDDTAQAPFRATRLWGLAGDDTLSGSPTRATCLFGGRGDDTLAIGTGGGIAYGEAGSDVVLGSALNDRLTGGAGVDAFAAGAGDDTIDSRDGVAEVVDCGLGDDTVRGDRADVLIGCESARLAGAPAVRVTPRPAKVRHRGLPKLRMTVPRSGRAGAYRVLLITPRAADATPGCTGGPVVLTRFPGPGDRVRKGDRVKVGLRAPKGGFCRGGQKAVVLYGADEARPAEPVARLGFRVTG